MPHTQGSVMPACAQPGPEVGAFSSELPEHPLTQGFVDMGFSRSVVVAALQQANGNRDGTLTLLLDPSFMPRPTRA